MYRRCIQLTSLFLIPNLSHNTSLLISFFSINSKNAVMAKIKLKILIINLLVSLAFAKPVVAYIKWQAQTLKRSRECFYCDLSNINLSNSNYKKMDVTGSVLKSADFSNTNLEEANFTNTDLTEAEFDSANLQEANLQRSILKRTNFWGANLQNANLRGADLTETIFWNADLREADLRDTNINNASFIDAQLKGAILPDGTVYPYK